MMMEVSGGGRGKWGNLNLSKRERGGGEMESGNLVESEGKNDIILRKKSLCLLCIYNQLKKNIIAQITFEFIAFDFSTPVWQII